MEQHPAGLMAQFLGELQASPVDFIGAWSLVNNPKDWNWRTHSHGYFEILYFLDGKAGISFGQESFRVSSFNMVLYPPDVEHKEVPDFGYPLQILCIQLHLQTSIQLTFPLQVSDDGNIIRWLFERALVEYQRKEEYNQEVCNLLCRSIFYFAGRLLMTHRAQPNEIVNRCLLYIHDHYSEEFSLEKLAVLAYASQSHLTRLFHRELGVSPMKYINRVRIEAAKKLLLQQQTTIHEIAALIGFSDPLYFSRLFRSATGMSPSEFKRLHL